MNKALPALLSSALLMSAIPSARAQNYGYDQGIADKLAAPINLVPGSLEDRLLDISRKSGLDVLMDATRSTSASTSTGVSTYVYNAIYTLSLEHNLSWLRRDERTLLLWNTPDVHALARGLASRRAIPTTTRDALPAELRGKVEARLQSPEVTNVLVGSRVALSDAAWKSARIFMEHDARAKEPRYADGLALLFSDEEGNGRLQEGLAYVNVAERKVNQSFKSNAAFDAALAAGAQNKPLAGAPDDAGAPEPLPGALQAADLKGEAILAAPVSGEWKKRPLAEALAELSRASHASLSVAPQAVAQKDAPKILEPRLSGRLSQAPLWQVMGDLSYLFHLRWTRSGAGYAAHLAGDGDVERQLVQLGNSSTLRALHHLERWPLMLAISQQVMDAVGIEPLQAKGGVLVSSLPPALGQKLRAYVEAEAEQDIVQSYQSTVPDVVAQSKPETFTP